MANPKFCFPNHTLPTATITPVATGSGWLSLTNLFGDVLSEMARYPGVNPTNTKFVIDLGTIRGASVFAIPFNNAQLGDLGRIRFATDSGFTDVVADSGWKEFWGEIYPYGSLLWGHPCWVDGHPTKEQIAGQVPAWMYLAPNEVLGRYVEVSLNFSTNTDGFVDIGQIVVSPAVSPVYNVSFGVGVPYLKDPSTKQRSKGGVQFSDKQKKYLATRMRLDYLSDAETYGQFYEMMRQYGVSKPLFFIYDSDAPAAILMKQSFMCTLENITPPSQTRIDLNSMDFEISQTF